MRFLYLSAPAAFRDVLVRPWLVVRVGRGLGMCEGAGLDFPLVLVHAIAHEPGHVTLSPDGHSPTGIMRARWGKAESDPRLFCKSY